MLYTLSVLSPQVTASGTHQSLSKNLSDFAVWDEVNEVVPNTRPQALKTAGLFAGIPRYIFLTENKADGLGALATP